MPHRLTRIAGVGAACGVALAIGCGGAAAKPKHPPPKAPNVDRPPPPAWIETESGAYWLAFSDFCWFTACADYKLPEERTDLPRITLDRGETVRFHLDFAPTRASLKVGSARFVLTARQVTSWRVRSGGVAVLEAHGELGRVSYEARFRVRAR
jgi:hypothetical protein